MEENKEIKVSSKTLFTLMGFVAICLLVFVRVLAVFGAGSAELFGVFFIISCGLSFAGAICSYLAQKKTSSEFWINVFAFTLAMLS